MRAAASTMRREEFDKLAILILWYASYSIGMMNWLILDTYNCQFSNMFIVTKLWRGFQHTKLEKDGKFKIKMIGMKFLH